MIHKLLIKLGPRTLIKFLTKTEEIQAQGGIDQKSGEGKRAKGGVFFYKIRNELPSLDWKEIQPNKSEKNENK